MARSRNIKPGFFLNEHLAELPPYTRLLFIGLWCLADRRGRLEDRPARIKAALFPFEPVDVVPMLEELAHSPGEFISRYQVDRQSFIQILHFHEHQHPHHKEAESVIPPYIPEKPGKGKCEPEASPRQAPTKASASPSDSLNLIPDTLTPDKCVFSKEIEEGFTYLAQSGNPNMGNPSWVKGYLKSQLERLAKDHINLAPSDILQCWRETVDTASAQGKGHAKWFYTVFESKLRDYLRKPEFIDTYARAGETSDTHQDSDTLNKRKTWLRMPYAALVEREGLDVIPVIETADYHANTDGPAWEVLHKTSGEALDIRQWEPISREQAQAIQGEVSHVA